MPNLLPSNTACQKLCETWKVFAPSDKWMLGLSTYVLLWVAQMCLESSSLQLDWSYREFVRPQHLAEKNRCSQVFFTEHGVHNVTVSKSMDVLLSWVRIDILPPKNVWNSMFKIYISFPPRMHIMACKCHKFIHFENLKFVGTNFPGSWINRRVNVCIRFKCNRVSRRYFGRMGQHSGLSHSWHPLHDNRWCFGS